MVLDNIHRYNLIEDGDRIVIGLSGGPDSVFLFHILEELREELNFSLYIAHVNHGIRGEDALSDQTFVEGLAKEYNIPFYLKLADMYGYAREHNLSSEEAGREIRYGFFNEILDSIGGGKIAVGHNKSDQVETMLMRFFRGTGLDGLRGMEYKIGNIIRPMLNISREDLEDYLDRKGYSYVIDKTNLESIYNRNKIRLETIPHIEKNYNPNVIDTIFKSSDSFKDDSDFLNDYSRDLLKKISTFKNGSYYIDRKEFLKEHRSIRSRVLRLSIESIRGSLQGVGQNHIYDSLDFIDRGSTGKSIDLIGGVRLSINYNEIELGLKKAKSVGEYSYSLSEARTIIDELNTVVDIRILNIEDFQGFSKNQYIKYFDYDKINSELRLRNRRNGDSFKPLGMKGKSKKLKDFFIDEKIERNKRDEVMILSDGLNILWVVGYRVSEDFKITEATKKVMEVKISRRI